MVQYISRDEQKEIFKLADKETVKEALDTLGYSKTGEIKKDEFAGFKELLQALNEKTIEAETETAEPGDEHFGDEIEM